VVEGCSGRRGCSRSAFLIFPLELRVQRHLVTVLVNIHGELARVRNNHVDIRLVTGRWGVLDLSHDLHTLGDLAKNDMAAIEPAGLDSANEKLGAISILASVSHGEDTGTSVGELEVLICETVTIDRLATSAVVVGEVTALDHELLDDTMKSRALVPIAILPSRGHGNSRQSWARSCHRDQ